MKYKFYFFVGKYLLNLTSYFLCIVSVIKPNFRLEWKQF